MERLVKYLTGVKQIMSDICDDPKKIIFKKHGENTYAKYKDIILVKAQITGMQCLKKQHLKKYGYFLIDSEDEDMLDKNNFVILCCIRKKYESVYIDVKSITVNYRKLLLKKYPSTNKKYSNYILKNYNPFDLRKQNLEQSVSRKNSKNKSGIVGVFYDKTVHAWCAAYNVNGRRLKRVFTESRHGVEHAKELAIKLRKKWEFLQNKNELFFP